MLSEWACLLCGNACEPEELCRTSFARIVRCVACGLVRAWPPRSGSDLAALHTARAYFGHPYFEARRDLGRESIRSKYRSILSLLTNGASQPGARLLDIGCDTGALLAFASEEFGWTVTGVEVSPLAAEAARRVHGIEVLADDVMNLDLPVGGYDYVTLVDVLEHTTEPLRLLAKLRRVLRQGGRLYVATSDHDALINSLILLLYRIAGRRSWPILEKLYIPYHEFYFNRTTLARAVMQSGFRVLYHQSREFPLDEFGHGWILKMGLVPIFLLQMVLRRPTLQELVAVKAA